jgi:hypothetical protein
MGQAGGEIAATTQRLVVCTAGPRNCYPILCIIGIDAVHTRTLGVAGQSGMHLIDIGYAKR